MDGALNRSYRAELFESNIGLTTFSEVRDVWFQ